MRKKTTLLSGVTFFLVIILSSSPEAGVSREEAARLGKDLTPVGAERVGNKEGTIPEWTGGITQRPAGFKPGGRHLDPFAGDKILFTISSENLEKYKDRLSLGQIALLKKYPEFRMNIYPTRRSVSYPQFYYDATVKNAVTATLYKGGDGVENAIIGVPFPIPKNGLQTIWNHLLRFRGETLVYTDVQAAVTASGKHILVKSRIKTLFAYNKRGATLETLENKLFFVNKEIMAPARLAGRVTIVHEPVNQMKEPRSAWQYNPGQRRVRRAPHLGYDNPSPLADGLRTIDQFDMFNGATDRYNWKLLGKREMYVPYNSYKLHSGKLRPSDILGVGHINTELARYELHRAWVVEAVLKEGKRHLYAKRVFYVDEDSWSILLVDIYDNRGGLWRVSEGHAINYYVVFNFMNSLAAHYDLHSGRYLVNGLDNQEKERDFSMELHRSEFSPNALRRKGRR